jgi:hypothetical protein
MKNSEREVYREDDEFGAGLNDLAEPTRALLARWRRNCLRSQIAHYKAAASNTGRHFILGAPCIGLSAIVGTSVFAALGKQVSTTPQIIVGSISVLAAVLAALQTFLQFNDKASKHRNTATVYGSIKREIDELLTLTGGEHPLNPECVRLVRQKMDTAASQAPPISESLWRSVHLVVPVQPPSSDRSGKKPNNTMDNDNQ